MNRKENKGFTQRMQRFREQWFSLSYFTPSWCLCG